MTVKHELRTIEIAGDNARARWHCECGEHGMYVAALYTDAEKPADRKLFATAKERATRAHYYHATSAWNTDGSYR